MSTSEMTPEQRTATAAGLYQEMLRTLPPASAMLTTSREELAERERAGHELGERLRAVVRGRSDA